LSFDKIKKLIIPKKTDDPVSEELLNAVAGMRLSFRVIFDIRFVKFCLYIVLFLSILYALSAFFAGEIDIIIYRLPYLILGVSSLMSLTLFFLLCRKYNFKLWNGIKLFILSDFNIVFWSISLFYVAGFILNSINNQISLIISKLFYLLFLLDFLLLVALHLNPRQRLYQPKY